MSDKNPIDELFKQKLKGHKIAPSNAAWEKIATATQVKSSGFKPMYLMRAAVVILLMGVSGLVYFQNNTERILKPDTIDILPQKVQVAPAEVEQIEENKAPVDVAQIEATKSVMEVAAVTSIPLKGVKTTGSVAAKEPKTTNNIIIPVTEIIDIEAAQIPDEKLDARKVADWKPKVELKLKATIPVTEEWMKESNVEKEDDKKLKDKVFAYANDQMNNLLSGKKLNFPKTPKGKPSLEINLDKLLN